MADANRFVPNFSLDLQQILEEAKHRWLRTTEICEILQNYKNFHITQNPPVKPAAGSLFLFDRKVLRYFRRDGHRWRKKKDGKTVREAHEKLKAAWMFFIAIMPMERIMRTFSGDVIGCLISSCRTLFLCITEK